MESEMRCNVSEMWSPKMPKGLDLEISHHPMTMRRVVNLIISMERFKASRSESTLSTEFTDENLLNLMLDSMIEEQIVCELESVPGQFIKTGEHLCSVTDSQKRSLIKVQATMELHAVMLQGGQDSHKVHLNMATYVNRAPSTDARPVALGIKVNGETEGKNLYLSCHMVGGKPTLHLEEVQNKSSLMSIGSQSDMVRFLFYKQKSGVNISTLMSARFPGWYVSTAEEDNMPVEMCQETADRYRTFNI